MNQNGGGRESLLNAYLAHADAKNRGTSNDSFYWAVEALNEIVKGDAEEAWSLIMELVRRAADDYSLAFIASGPLENLLAAHGELVIDRLEVAARADGKLRRALTAVWGETRISEELLARVRALSEGEEPL